MIRAIRAMDEADVCMLLIDATNGLTAQDVSIFSLATRKGKGVVILVNKWDLMAKETNTARDFEKQIKEKLEPFTDVPVIFISASEKSRIFQGMEKALEVYENRGRRVTTSVLNEIMLKEIERYPPPFSRGYAVRIKFVSQVPTAGSFVCILLQPPPMPLRSLTKTSSRISYAATSTLAVCLCAYS